LGIENVYYLWQSSSIMFVNDVIDQVNCGYLQILQHYEV
jgi:hypothetical protein